MFTKVAIPLGLMAKAVQGFLPLLLYAFHASFFRL